MSLFKPQNLTCPSCGQEVTVRVAGSINADRRPDFRQAILDNSFQDTTCARCETSFRVQPRFNYLDIENGMWIAAMPGPDMSDYLAIEDSARATFEGSYGASAPQAAQDIGGALNTRLTFGWSAIREKLLIASLGLDDVVVEQVKLDLLRRLPDAPLRPGVELRLVGMEDGRMQFRWLETLGEAGIEQVELDRSLYDLIAADREGWAAITEQLTDGMFVDMQKLYMGQGREDEEADADPVEG